jgi:membrane fusion protein (multidrug efflux system)
MNSNQRTFVTALSIGILLIFGYVIFSKPAELEKPKSKINTDVYVRTIQVKPSTNSISFSGHGRVTAARRINIVTEVQGKLLAGGVALKTGTAFKKGDVLFKINNTEMRLALQAKKSNFLNRVANILPDLQIDFESDFETWNRFFNSIEPDKNLPSIPKIKNSKLKTFLATKNVLSDYYSILVDEERLTKYAITAPFAGTILTVNAQIGTAINPGSPVATIINTSNLEVEIPLPKDQAKMINIGSKVVLQTESKEELIGTVKRVGESININTQSLSVFVSTNTSKLYDGMYLSAEIIAKSMDNTMKAPTSALQLDGKVLMVNNNKLNSRAVNILYQNNDYMILKGIDKPIELVVEQINNQTDSMTVKTISGL